MGGLDLHAKAERRDERRAFPGFFVVVEVVLLGIFAVLMYGLIRMI